MRLEGKTILVTGATDGVGRVVAKRLAAEGANVLIHGRSQERAEQVLREICGARVRPKKGMATFYQADFASLAEVRRLAEILLQERERIDCLVNNAGIGSGPDKNRRELSKDGFELRFAVNYLAGFLLTRLLLPRLEASAPARIVNVSSAGQQAIDFADVMLIRGYSGARAYCQSKLAQVMLTIDLADELAGTGVTATCLHPATYMNTTMVHRICASRPGPRRRRHRPRGKLRRGRRRDRYHRRRQGQAEPRLCIGRPLGSLHADRVGQDRGASLQGAWRRSGRGRGQQWRRDSRGDAPRRRR